MSIIHTKNFLILIGVLVSFISPLKSEEKKYLVLHDDNYCHGLFSCFSTVIGLLDHYDNGDCAGFEVDYEKKGFYYEDDKGLNWWTYYFKPLELGSSSKAEKAVVDSWWHHHFAHKVYFELSRERCCYLVDKYISVKGKIEDKADEFVKKKFKSKFVIGVNYRGTDKKCEAARLPYETVKAAVLNVMNNLNIKQDGNFAIFVATDEEQFLDYMIDEFEEHVVYTKAFRSSNEVPVHLHKENYEKGKQAVIDCLLLSKCDYLVRTSSSLSLCATFFNPKIPSILLNPGIYDRKTN